MTKSYYSNIFDYDWEMFIQRQEQPPFLNSLWMQIEGPLSIQLIRGGFTKQLCLRYGDDNLWIRSTSDRAAMRKKIRRFLNTQSENVISKFFAKARMYSDDAANLIREIKKKPDSDILNHFDALIHRVNEILLYTTSVPYLFLDAIENVQPSAVKNYRSIQRKSEKLRARSFYREIKKHVLDRISTAVAKKFHTQKHLIESLTVSEMRQSILLNKLVVSPKLLAARETCAYWDFGDGKVVFSSDSRLMQKIKTKVFPSSVGSAHIKGTSAFSGIVTGVVRIVNLDSEMHKLQRGEILVASTTNPSLLPAMKRSGAIVTDEGGMACHAAIVARELKKPCVMGTKVATSLLRNGDLVEVDANNGIVKKLSTN